MDDSPSGSRGRVRVEPALKRVRIMLGRQVVADTTDAAYVWENPSYPQYYIPLADVADGALKETGTTSHSPSRGTATHFSVHGGDRVAEDAAWCYRDSPLPALRDRARFDWWAMDAWFEEDEEVFVHPRSPYTRVDILRASRPVRIEVDGVVVADTTHPTFLFETGLPRRTYIPKLDVRMDRLEPTGSVTMCPYKGTARYWAVRTGAGLHPDLAWSYDAPFRESAPIAGLVAFYDEKVDVYVDGGLQPRPRTAFS